MAKRYRLSMFFDEPKQGWSENWYFESEQTLIATLLLRFQNLANYRAALLGKGAQLSHMRISEILDTATGEKEFRVFDGDDLNIKGSSRQTLCAPHDSLLVRCITSDGKKQKVVYLGGVWMSIFDELRHYEPSGTFDTLLQAWASEVKAQGMGWVSQVKDEDRVITGYTVDPVSGRTTYELDGPITMIGKPPVRRVVVEFPGEHHVLDGVQLVAPVVGSPNSVVTVRPRAAGAFNGIHGAMRDYTYTFSTLSNVGQNLSVISAKRMARRNRGKASYAEVGRQKARARG